MVLAFPVRCENCSCQKYFCLDKSVGSDLSSRKTPFVCNGLFVSGVLSGYTVESNLAAKYIIQVCGNHCKCEEIFTISVDTSSSQSSRSFGSVFCCKARKGAFLEKLGGDAVPLDVYNEAVGSTFY